MNPTTTDPRDQLILSLCKQIERLQFQVITLTGGTIPRDTP